MTSIGTKFENWGRKKSQIKKQSPIKFNPARVPIRIQKAENYATLGKETVLNGIQGEHQGFTYKKEMPRKILSLKSDLF